MIYQEIAGIPTIVRYGITEKKKEELDLLTIQVLNQQGIVEKLKATVSSLTVKSQNFQAYLAATESNKLQALSNRNLLDQVVNNALDLKKNSETAFTEIVLADSRTKAIATNVKDVIDKLIYSAEVINKLANLVVRKKTSNPLISDELVSMLTTAGTDANNAVALTLVALQSTFALQAANIESEAAVNLETTQATKLYEILTGTDVNGADDVDVVKDKKVTYVGRINTCIKILLYKAYNAAEKTYNVAFIANTEAIEELNITSADLEKAQVKLNSLQLGLAAAEAAALAS